MSPEGIYSAKSSPHFTQNSKAGVSNRCQSKRGKYIKLSTRKLHYGSARSSAFSTLEKLASAVPKRSKSDVRTFRKTRCINSAQTREEAFIAQSLYCYERDGRVVMRSAGRTIPRKTQRNAQMNSISHRFLFEISASAPRNDKQWHFRRLGVSFHILRR